MEKKSVLGATLSQPHIFLTIIFIIIFNITIRVISIKLTTTCKADMYREQCVRPVENGSVLHTSQDAKMKMYEM